MPIELKNGKFKTGGGIELEVFDGVLIEYDGEVKAIEEEVEVVEKVELDQMKVRYWRAYVDAKMLKEFGYHTKKDVYSTKTNLESYPWEQCIIDQMKTYGDKETAEKVCGSIKAKYGN